MVPASPGGYWRRPAGFVFAAIAALVGVGVVLRLPMLAEAHGGAAFLSVYLFWMVVVAWPLLTAETLFGRVMRQDLPGALYDDVQTRGSTRGWLLIAGLFLLVPLLVVSYYTVIAGWNAAFAVRALGGALAGASADGLSTPFLTLAQDAERSMAWQTIFVVASCVLVARGVRVGIERGAALLLLGGVVLLFLLGILVIRDGDPARVTALWTRWDWAALGWRGVLEALQQALFSAGLGLGMMAAYAGYLPERARLARLTAMVLVGSTVFALIAGSLLVGLLGDMSSAGDGQMALLFVAPVELAVRLDGRLTPGAIYVLMTALSVASTIALLEPLVQFVMARKRCTRVYATTVIGVAVWLLGLVTVLTFGSTVLGELGGRSLFGWLQSFSIRLGAPLALLLMVIYVGRVWSRVELDAALHGDSEPRDGPDARPTRRALLMRFMLVYPTRIAAILALVYGLGIADWLIAFWSDT